jgi:hypothetical protein
VAKNIGRREREREGDICHRKQTKRKIGEREEKNN